MRRLTVILLLLCSLGFAAWCFCAMGQGKGWADDYPYTHLPAAGLAPAEADAYFFSCRGPEITGIGDALSAMPRHYVGINGRLANMIMFALGLLPAWVIALLQGAAYAAMLGGVMRLALGPGWRSRPLALIGAAMLLWIALPWSDTLVSQDYLVNYVWSAALNVWTLAALFSPDLWRKKRYIALAAAAALMHEGMSVAMDAGLCLYILLNLRRFRAEPRRWVLPAIYILFSLVPILAPSVWALAAVKTGSPFTLSELARLVRVCWLPACVALLMCVPRLRARIPWPRLCVLTVAAVVGIGVAAAAHAGDRACWLPILLALAIGVGVLAPRREPGRAAATAACMLGALMAGWYAVLCTYQWRFSQERERVLTVLRSGRNVIPFPVMEYSDTPWYLLQIPGQTGGNDETIRSNLAAEAWGDAERRFVINPDGPLSWHTAAPMPEPVCTLTLTDKGRGAAGRAPYYTLYYKLRGRRRVTQPVQLEHTAVAAGADTVHYYRPVYLAAPLFGWEPQWDGKGEK